MKKILFFLIPLFFVTSSFAGLKGQEREKFIQSVYKPCFKNQRSNPINKNINDKSIGQYCSCYAAYMSDMPNTDIYYQIEKGEVQISALSNTIQTAANYCVNNLSKY